MCRWGSETVGKSKSRNKRVQFDFDEEDLARLDDLVRSVHAPTRAAVIRGALALYREWAEVRSQGFQLGILDKKDQVVARLRLIGHW